VKYFKLIGCVVGGLFLLGICLIFTLFLTLRYWDSTNPIIAGGGQVAPNGLLTARSLAIVERPFLGKEHRYYRFELREGGPNNGNYGRILKEVTMEPLSGEEFRMPRAAPAFPLKWSDDNTAVTFSAQGIDLTLRK